jgi:hypothetical protein
VFLPCSRAGAAGIDRTFFKEGFGHLAQDLLAARPPAPGRHRPRITGPGLAGPGFRSAHGGC